jgi:hypothetical protein
MPSEAGRRLPQQFRRNRVGFSPSGARQPSPQTRSSGRRGSLKGLRQCLLRPPLRCTRPLPDCQTNPRPMLDGFRENLAPNATLDTLADALEAI